MMTMAMMAIWPIFIWQSWMAWSDFMYWYFGTGLIIKKKPRKYNAVGRRNPEPPWMVEPFKNGIHHLSTGAGVDYSIHSILSIYDTLAFIVYEMKDCIATRK